MTTFINGDEVYVAGQSDKYKVEREMDESVYITNEAGCSRSAFKSTVSFDPWPKANHTRKLVKGWYIIAFGPQRSGSFGIRRMSEYGLWYVTEDNSIPATTPQNIHKYLGETL